MLRLAARGRGALRHPHRLCRPRRAASPAARRLLSRCAPRGHTDASLAGADRRRAERGGRDGAGLRVRGVLPDGAAPADRAHRMVAPGSARLFRADKRHSAPAADACGLCVGGGAARLGRSLRPLSDGSRPAWRGALPPPVPARQGPAGRPIRRHSRLHRPMDIIKSSPFRTNKRIARLRQRPIRK